MSHFEHIYLMSWLGLSVFSLGLLLAKWRILASEFQCYGRFLFVPWKLAFFVPAFVFLCIAGPYTNDPTWDVMTGGGMALLTFCCAPWSIGVLATCKPFGNASFAWWRVWLAVFALFFSSSWFYDG